MERRNRVSGDNVEGESCQDVGREKNNRNRDIGDSAVEMLGEGGVTMDNGEEEGRRRRERGWERPGEGGGM